MYTMDKRQKQNKRRVNTRRNNVPKSQKKNVELTPVWAMKTPKMPKHWKGHADPTHDLIIQEVKKA